VVKRLSRSDKRHIYEKKHKSNGISEDWYNRHKGIGLQRNKNCDLRELKEHNLKPYLLYYCEGISVYVIFFPDFFIIPRFIILCCIHNVKFQYCFMYVLLFSNSKKDCTRGAYYFTQLFLPLSGLFCLKGSLNLKECWSNFLEVLVRVVRSEWFKRNGSRAVVM